MELFIELKSELNNDLACVPIINNIKKTLYEKLLDETFYYIKNCDEIKIINTLAIYMKKNDSDKISHIIHNLKLFQNINKLKDVLTIFDYQELLEFKRLLKYQINYF